MTSEFRDPIEFLKFARERNYNFIEERIGKDLYKLKNGKIINTSRGGNNESIKNKEGASRSSEDSTTK